MKKEFDMGIFSWLTKKPAEKPKTLDEPLFVNPPPDQVNIYDLVYLYHLQGEIWKAIPEDEWSTWYGFRDHRFAGTWKRLIDFGLIRKSNPTETMLEQKRNILQRWAEEYGVKSYGTKAEIVKKLDAAGVLEECSKKFTPYVKLTDEGQRLMSKHDYIPIFWDKCWSLLRGQHERIFTAREQFPDKPIRDLILDEFKPIDFQSAPMKGKPKDYVRPEAMESYNLFVEELDQFLERSKK